MQISEIKLTSEQVSLLICESSSGIIMDSGLNYLPGNQIHFSVFPSLEAAKLFIEAKQKANTTFQVYNHKNEMLYELTLERGPLPIKKRKKFWQLFNKK